MGPGLTQNFLFGKSSQNSPKPELIFWSSLPCVLFLTVNTLLKVVGYYDLSVLSMLVMGFHKSLYGGWVGGWMGGWGGFVVDGFLDFF